MVLDKGGRVTKRGYTLCFLDKLQDSLRRRDIYVENSDRWGDPRAKLLQGQEWQSKPNSGSVDHLGHPLNAKEAIDALVRQLDTTYHQVAANFDDNGSVDIDISGKRPALTITNIDRLDNPPSLQGLSKQVEALLPAVDLTELLLEVNAHTAAYCR